MLVELSNRVKKILHKIPEHVLAKLLAWIDLVENEGLHKARLRSGFHDESLKGILKEKRSIRLSRQWRAIYTVKASEVKFILIEEITPHEYKK